jgi:hypothetical protein
MRASYAPPMNDRLATICCTALLAATSTASYAQLGKATPEELSRRGNGPGPVSGAGSNGSPNTFATETGEAPPADPRNFAGFWRAGGAGQPGGARVGGGPGSAGGAGGGGPGGPGGAGYAAQAAGRLPDRILCLPQSGTQAGGDGPLLLVQTPEQITWAAEEMHTIRRIYLSGDYTPAYKANFYGEAQGHWDGNTLVIETRNLKSLAAGAIQMERWTKSADGKQLEMKISTVGADGATVGTVRTSTLGWRTGDQVLEWMCEDYNDEWLPGGADFNDQVGSKS